MRSFTPFVVVVALAGLPSLLGCDSGCKPCMPGPNPYDHSMCGQCVAIGDASSPDANDSDGGDADDDAAADSASDAMSDAASDAAAACSLSATYLAYDDGGLRQFVEKTTLTPPRTDTTVEVSGNTNDGSACPRELTCASASQVTVPQIETAVANADVQAALAMPDGTLFGSDPRPVDGTVWVFKRNGHGFAVGSGTVPPGLTALETLMRQLTADTHASPECSTLLP